MKFLASLLSLFISIQIFAQQMPESYEKQVLYADSLYQAKDYRKAASAYAYAFKMNGKKGLVEDRYHAAISYALSSNSDSAFYNLFRMADKAGWNKYELLTTDSSLKSLHSDERWNKLVNKVRNNKAESEIRTKGVVK
jgi:hypothetical protein